MSGYIPTEAEEAKTLVAYLRVRGYKFTHIPNETGGSMEARRRAIRMKQQGTAKGVPDYMILIPGSEGNGLLLAVEMKRTKGGTLSPEQREWIDALNALGQNVAAVVCKGADEAITVIEQYRKAVL
jgi:hypothetical protein